MEGSDGPPRRCGLVGRGCHGDTSLACAAASALLCLKKAGRKPDRETWGRLGPFGRNQVPRGERDQACGCLNDLSRKRKCE